MEALQLRLNSRPTLLGNVTTYATELGVDMLGYVSVLDATHANSCL